MAAAVRHAPCFAPLVDPLVPELCTPCPQGEAIAVNLREMFGFRVPIISVVIGEGGSGGALAIGCANRNLIMENRCVRACVRVCWACGACHVGRGCRR